MRVEPGLAIKDVQGYAAPLQVVSAMRIAVDLNMHHQRTGLLYLADLAELYPVAEAGADLAAAREGAEVSGRYAGQHEEYCPCAEHDQKREHRCGPSHRERHLPVSRIITRELGPNCSLGRRTPHFHQDAGHHSHQHEYGE